MRRITPHPDGRSAERSARREPARTSPDRCSVPGLARHRHADHAHFPGRLMASTPPEPPPQPLPGEPEQPPPPDPVTN